MTKLKYTPEIRERAVQLLIESEKEAVLLKHYVFGIKNT